MKWTAAFLTLLLAACVSAERGAPVSGGAGPSCAVGPVARSPGQIWKEAHCELGRGGYAAAEHALVRLAREHPESGEGWAAWYHLGLLRLDARNSARDPKGAAAAFRKYLSRASAAHPAPRAVEAAGLLAVAEDLVRRDAAAAGRARELAARVDSLRGELKLREAALAAREQELRGREEELKLKEEQLRTQGQSLERMRRILSSKSNGTE